MRKHVHKTMNKMEQRIIEVRIDNQFCLDRLFLSTAVSLFKTVNNEEYPTSCSPKKVFPTKFKLAWKF